VKYTLKIPLSVLSTIPSPSTRLTVASLYTLPLVVWKSSESASDANRTARSTTVVLQYLTRRDSAAFTLCTATQKWDFRCWVFSVPCSGGP